MFSSDKSWTDELAGKMQGPVLGPGDEGYDEARALWNGRFDRRPAVIAQCADASDVAAAVNFAMDHGITLSVKGGGHAYAGNTVGDGDLLIDLSPMNSVSVDAGRRRAFVQAGCSWGMVDAATHEHGLATTGGTVSTVGVAGFTLGGGSGWLSRKHGLAVDNLVGAEVVTAAGEIVRADGTENPDLFWALRGGSGNFGVVTSFEYTLHDMESEILAGQILYPADRASELLQFYRDYFRDAPDEVMCYPFFLRVPPVDAFPEAFHGAMALDFVVAYMGPVQDGESHLAPFRENGNAILDAVFPQSYLTLQQAFDAGMGRGNRWYSRSVQMGDLTDEAIDTLVGRLEPFPGELTVVYLGPGGGAIGRKASHAVAYPHRSSAHELHIFPGWLDAGDDAANMAWADAFLEAMLPFGNGAVYVNLLGDGEEARVPAAYGANYERLRVVKREWDPRNLFHRNHNIPPEY